MSSIWSAYIPRQLEHRFDAQPWGNLLSIYCATRTVISLLMHIEVSLLCRRRRKRSGGCRRHAGRRPPGKSRRSCWHGWRTWRRRPARRWRRRSGRTAVSTCRCPAIFAQRVQSENEAVLCGDPFRMKWTTQHFTGIHPMAKTSSNLWPKQHVCDCQTSCQASDLTRPGGSHPAQTRHTVPRHRPHWFRTLGPSCCTCLMSTCLRVLWP